jgi:hypothetical protein
MNGKQDSIIGGIFAILIFAAGIVYIDRVNHGIFPDDVYCDFGLGRAIEFTPPNGGPTVRLGCSHGTLWDGIHKRFHEWTGHRLF